MVEALPQSATTAHRVGTAGTSVTGATTRTRRVACRAHGRATGPWHDPDHRHRDRKSTRLNSSHVSISYAVFCLKKKKTETEMETDDVVLIADHIEKLHYQ